MDKLNEIEMIATAEVTVFLKGEDISALEAQNFLSSPEGLEQMKKDFAVAVRRGILEGVGADAVNITKVQTFLKEDE